MGLEELRTEILKRSFEEVRRLEAEAEEEERRILENAQLERKRVLEMAREEAERQARAERDERIAAARLRARRLVAEAREEVLSRALERVWEEFAAIVKGEAYHSLLKSIVEAGLRELGNDALVSVNEEDVRLVRKWKVKLGEPIQTEGGAIITSQDGRIRVSGTLRDLFVQRREFVKKKLSDSIFGGGK